MAVYQVAIIFEADTDEHASVIADGVSKVAMVVQDAGGIKEAKIAFTKFEQEAPEVADKPVV